MKTYGTNLEDLGIIAAHAAEERAAWDLQHGRAELHQAKRPTSPATSWAACSSPRRTCSTTWSR